MHAHTEFRSECLEYILRVQLRFKVLPAIQFEANVVELASQHFSSHIRAIHSTSKSKSPFPSG